MPIGAQRAAVQEGAGERVDNLFTSAPQEAGDDGGRSDAHEQNVIKPYAIETIFQREDALDFVRLNQGEQDLAHRERRFAFARCVSAEVIGDGKDAAEIIGGMTPLRSEPGIVEVEPAHHRADIEGGLNRIKFIASARNARALFRHRGSRHEGAEQLGAGGIGEREQGAAEAVHQAESGRMEGFRARDAIHRERIVRDLLQERVRGRTCRVGQVAMRHGEFLSVFRSAQTAGSRGPCNGRWGE